MNFLSSGGWILGMVLVAAGDYPFSRSQSKFLYLDGGLYKSVHAELNETAGKCVKRRFISNANTGSPNGEHGF